MEQESQFTEALICISLPFFLFAKGKLDVYTYMPRYFYVSNNLSNEKQVNDAFWEKTVP